MWYLQLVFGLCVIAAGTLSAISGLSPPGGVAMWFCFLLPLLAIIPAMIANSKGRSGIAFYFYGLFLFIIALPHALLMSSNQASVAERPGMKQCPSCLSAIPAAATKCKHCTADQPATG